MIAATLIEAQPNTPYRLEWIIDGDRIDALKREGTTETSSDEVFTSIIRVTEDPDTGRVIDSCIEPLLRGTYELEVYLGDTLYRKTAIEIR